VERVFPFTSLEKVLVGMGENDGNPLETAPELKLGTAVVKGLKVGAAVKSGALKTTVGWLMLLVGAGKNGWEVGTELKVDDGNIEGVANEEGVELVERLGICEESGTLLEMTIPVGIGWTVVRGIAVETGSGASVGIGASVGNGASVGTGVAQPLHGTTNTLKGSLVGVVETANWLLLLGEKDTRLEGETVGLVVLGATVEGASWVVTVVVDELSELAIVLLGI